MLKRRGKILVCGIGNKPALRLKAAVPDPTLPIAAVGQIMRFWPTLRRWWAVQMGKGSPAQRFVQPR